MRPVGRLRSSNDDDDDDDDGDDDGDDDDDDDRTWSTSLKESWVIGVQWSRSLLVWATSS